MLGIIAGLIIIIVIVVIYILPTSKIAFRKIYAKVPADTSRSLQAFRSNHPLNKMIVEGMPWNYISLGQGPQTILLLHGMGGGRCRPQGLHPPWPKEWFADCCSQ